MLVTSAADVDEILPGLQERWRGRLYVTRSQPDYIEFADGSVSKSGALAWLCERLGVARGAVVAFGDGMNDVDMLEWAGLGVAVAEAAGAGARGGRPRRAARRHPGAARGPRRGGRAQK